MPISNMILASILPDKFYSVEDVCRELNLGIHVTAKNLNNLVKAGYLCKQTIKQSHAKKAGPVYMQPIEGKDIHFASCSYNNRTIYELPCSTGCTLYPVCQIAQSFWPSNMITDRVDRVFSRLSKNKLNAKPA